MARRKIKPNELFLFLADSLVGGDPDYKTIVCLTDLGASGTSTVIDASSRCGSDQQPGQKTYSRTFTGQDIVDEDAAEASIKQIYDWWAAGTTLYAKISPVAPVAGDLIEEGTGFISAYGEGDTYNTQPTFNGTLSFNDLPTKTVFP